MNNYIKQNESKKWRDILGKTNAIKVLLPHYQTQINVSGNLGNAFHRKLPKKHILKINRNIWREVI